MKYLSFSDGSKIPQLGLGTWKSDPGVVGAAISEAIQAGYRHIDCASIYGNEDEIGTALHNVVKTGAASRNDLFITSKLWNDMHRTEDVVPAIKQTLYDLKLDYLDLYLIHWPISVRKGAQFPFQADDFVSNKDMPFAETWEAMEEVKEMGLSKHIGVSNFSISNLSTLLRSCKIKPEMNQVELHPFLQQNKLLDFCKDHDILVTAYSPLGSPDRSAGLKADKEPSLLQNSLVNEISNDLNCSPAQVLLAWAMERGTCVIPKSTNPGRIRENFASQEIQLSRDAMDSLNSLETNFRYVDGSFWTIDGSPYSLEYLWG